MITPAQLSFTAEGTPYAEAYDALTETIRVMSADVIAEACVTIPVSGKPLDATAIAAAPEFAAKITSALGALVRASAETSRRL